MTGLLPGHHGKTDIRKLTGDGANWRPRAHRGYSWESRKAERWSRKIGDQGILMIILVKK